METAVAAQWEAYQVHWDEPQDPTTYARFFVRTWPWPEALVVVEGDSVPPPGSIEALVDCPEPWCAHPSWVGDRYLRETLGLVKFSRELQRRHPGAALEAMTRGRFDGSLCPARSVDVAWARQLSLMGLRVHPHEPPARHLRYANEPAGATRWRG